MTNNDVYIFLSIWRFEGLFLEKYFDHFGPIKFKFCEVVNW